MRVLVSFGLASKCTVNCFETFSAKSWQVEELEDETHRMESSLDHPSASVFETLYL